MRKFLILKKMQKRCEQNSTSIKFYSIKVSNICEKAQKSFKNTKNVEFAPLFRRIWTSLFLRFHRFLLLLFSQTSFYWPSAVAPLIPIICPSFLLSLQFFQKS